MLVRGLASRLSSSRSLLFHEGSSAILERGNQTIMSDEHHHRAHITS